MTAVSQRPAGERLRAHVRIPLHRAGYALVANAALTSVLGLVYWTVAARSYPPAAVGAAAGLLAGLQVVTNVAQLGFRHALIRFVPSVGDRAGRLVALAYGLCGLAAMIGALAFVVVHDRWLPELTLLDRPAGVALFVAAAVVWMVFILQDSVLVAARRAPWVPVENLLYGALKLVALVAVAGSLPDAGIFLSWVAPLLVLVIPVNIALFGWLLPALGARPARERLSGRDVARFAAGDYTGSLLWHTTLDLMPLVVIAVAGATEGAYYALAWTIAYSLYLVPSGIGSALVAEAAHAPTELAVDSRRALRQALMLVLPAALALVLTAPLLLGVLGAEYSAEATTLLRLLALSAVPHVVTSLYVNLCRARRAVRSLMVLYLWFCLAVLGGGAVLVGRIGATGAGIAWLTVQTLTATALLATTLRPVAIAALPTRLLRRIGRVTSAPSRRRTRRAVRSQIPELEAAMRRQGLLGGEVIQEIIQTGADESVLRIADVDGPPLIVKVCATPRAVAGRIREYQLLASLADAPWLSTTRRLAPRPVATGTIRGHSWFAETAVGVWDGTAVLARHGAEAVVAAGVEAVAELHLATAEVVIADEDLVAELVGRPAAIVASALPALAPAVDAIVDELDAALRARLVQVAFAHGDLHAGNVILDEELRPAGLVDWVGARERTPPEIDVATLAVTARADQDQREVGAVFADLIAGAPDRLIDEALSGLPSAEHNAAIGRRALFLLTWLDHVANNLDKAGTYAANDIWVLRNVAVVADGFTPAGNSPIVTEDEPVPGPHRVTPPPPEAAGGAPPERDVRWPLLVSLAALVVGPALWATGFTSVDPRSLGDLGVGPELPVVALIGLGLLGAGFALLVARRAWPDRLGAAYVVALAACLHGVPAAAYETLRYSWAWKHLGVIDYIARTGTVDPAITTGDAYHNWPGFFAAAQVIGELAGVDPFTLARWAPAFFGIIIALAVAFLLGGLTQDRRIVWVGAWFAVLVNWVGQEYFSPQATAFVLYLLAIGLALRLRGPRRWRRRSAATATVLIVTLAAAVAVSHQLTPLILVLALVGLAVVDRGRFVALAVTAATLAVGWALWGADTFVQAELVDELAELGSPVDNATGSLVDPSRISAGQQLVTLGGRVAVAAAAGLAAVGLFVWWRHRPRDVAPVWLLVLPLPLLALSGYGGEVMLRVLLFASPLLGYFAALGLLGLGDRRRLPVRAAAVGVASLVLAGGFLVAHYGKDGYYVFGPGEVAAAEFIHARAPEGTLLIEGSRNYPKQFRNYERFRYVAIEREPAATQRRINRRPVAAMADWMSDPRDAAAYLLITRSQKEELAALGIGPERMLTRVERALRRSDRFRIAFEAPDAVVFVLVER